MSVDIKQRVDTNSTEFDEGVEARLSSAEDANNLQAGNELGQALKDEVKMERPVDENLFKESTIPVFMRDSSEGYHGNAQDEKDEVGE